MTESVTRINKQLETLYGKHDNGEPNWRVVWSEDQFEKRRGDYEDRTPEGLLIRAVNEVRTVPKYRQWVHEKWVLEHLTPIPEMQQDEIVGKKLSYEPIYVFQTVLGDPLPPKIEPIKFLIDHLLQGMNEPPKTRYKDPESDPKEAAARQQMKISKIQEELFGNESDVSDALARGDAVGFTTSKEFSGQKGKES